MSHWCLNIWNVNRTGRLQWSWSLCMGAWNLFNKWVLLSSDYVLEQTRIAIFFLQFVHRPCDISQKTMKSSLEPCCSKGVEVHSYSVWKHIACLCVWYLIKDPDLSIDCGPWHPVAVVVEEDSFLLGITSQRRAKLLHLVHRGVQALFVTRLKNREGRDKGVRMIILHLKIMFWALLHSDRRRNYVISPIMTLCDIVYSIS